MQSLKSKNIQLHCRMHTGNKTELLHAKTCWRAFIYEPLLASSTIKNLFFLAKPARVEQKPKTSNSSF